MIRNLKACSVENNDPIARQELVTRLREKSGTPLLVLDTCQRLEAYGIFDDADTALTGAEAWSQQEALERLARIAAGLESRILGELEILGQVRNAYKQFRSYGGHEHSRLDRIFQDALALARKARRESGIDQNLTSLGAIASRQMIDAVPDDLPVAVVGSGSIATSVARYLGKRGSMPVRISSRCPDNAMSLAEEVGGFSSGLDELAHIFDGVSGIVTATAAPHPLIYKKHLSNVKNDVLIIDLGEPADCSEEVQQLDGINYLSLVEVETRAQVNTEDRVQRAQVAERIIKEVAANYPGEIVRRD